MKSRMNSAWFKSRAKDICKDCKSQMIEEYKKDFERAIREGFRAGIGVALKCNQLYQGYGKKRLQREFEDIRMFTELKIFGKEIEFNVIEDVLREEYDIDISELKISVDVQSEK